MSPILQLLCLCTSVAYGPVPQVARSAGDIWYTHETLGGGRHLLRLSSTDLLLDGDRERGARLKAFARDFAARTCRGSFRVVDGNRLTTYAGQVVFVCR
jgi:hypothetical protein